VYTPFSRQGTIRQQDIQACNITRSAIARSLVLEARRTTLLVTTIICKVHNNQMTPKSIEALQNDILNDSTLRELRRRTDANVDTYSCFVGLMLLVATLLQTRNEGWMMRLASVSSLTGLDPANGLLACT